MTAVHEPLTGTAPSEVVVTPTDPGRRVVTVARWLIGVQVVVVTWASFHGWFFNDDFVFRGQGARYAWFDPAYLFQPWGGHFMPASFAVAQVVSKLGDFSYLPVAASLAVGQALVAVLVYRFLFRHFGARWRVLLPLVLYLTSIPVLQATVWWASALNALPLLACMVIIADRTLRAARSPRPAHWIWIVATFTASLTFFEKSVLILVVVAFLLLATTPGVHGRPSPARVLRRHWPLFVALLVVLAGWYVLYRANKTADLANAPNLPTLSDQLSVGLAGTFVPSLFGGPWDWGVLANGYTLVYTSPWLVMLLCLTALGIGLVLWSAGPRARTAILMVVTYAVCLLILVNIGRSQFLVATSGLPRYYADLTIVTVIALALSTCRLVDDPAPEMLHEWTPRPTRRVLVVGGVLAQILLLSWLVASVGLGSSIGETPQIPWVTTAVRSLHTSDTGDPVLDGPVPGTVLWGLVYPYNTYSWFFAGVRGAPAFEDQSGFLRAFDDAGHLVPGHVAGPASIDRPAGACGWRVTDSGTAIPMVNEIINWRHTMHIAYLANVAGDVRLWMDSGSPRTVHVQPGLRDLYATFDGGGQSVHLQATAPGVTLCVDKIEIGEPAAGLAEP